MADQVPAWKFWHPLPFWQALLLAFVLELVCTFAVVALREGAGLSIPSWTGSALGGGLMFVVIRAAAMRRAAALAAK